MRGRRFLSHQPYRRFGRQDIPVSAFGFDARAIGGRRDDQDARPGALAEADEAGVRWSKAQRSIEPTKRFRSISRVADGGVGSWPSKGSARPEGLLVTHKTRVGRIFSSLVGLDRVY